MHFSSIVFIIISILFFILRKQKHFFHLLIIPIPLLVITYRYFLDIIKIFFPMYANYFSNTKTIQSVGFSFFIWIIILGISLIELFYYENNVNNQIIAIFSILFVAFNLIGLSFNYGERIGLFFLPFVMVLYDNFNLKLNKYLSVLFKSGLIVCYTVYFILSSSTAQYSNYSFF